jgi:hypothetical protein
VTKEVDFDFEEMVEQHEDDDPRQFLLDPFLKAIDEANISFLHY